jgi:hypothetical protein
VIVSVRPEVYALQTALSLGALLAALRALASEDARLLLLAALLIGLGVANHPLVAGLAGAGATLAAIPFLRTHRARLVGWSVLALLAGLATIAYLPARASALFAHADAGTINWGDARSLAGLHWVLSARTFASKASIVHTAAAPLDLPYVLMEELELVFALLAPIGMVLGVRRAEARLPALVLLGGWAGSVTAALVAGFDPANPDVRGYLGPGIALTALFSTAAIAAGLVPMERWKRPWVAPALAGLLAASTITRFPAGGDYPGLRRTATADVMTGELLAELPPRAALLTAHFESAFLVGYQRVVEGRRPDADWAHLGFLGHPGYRDRVVAAQPALRPLLDSRLALGPMVALAERRPVRVESDEHLGREVRARLVPAASTWKLGDGRRPDHAITWPPALAFEEAARDRQVRGFVAWRAYSDAILACENGLAEAARVHLSVLGRLLPRDERALALQGRCGSLSNKQRILRGAP